ncbi:MAG: Bax inhibitor-1/YccA family protein, partial [Candidatus Margulisiibacteriota bacterium]
MVKQITSQVASLQQNFFNRVYGWMTLALLITGFSAMYVVSSHSLVSLIFGNPMILFGLIILELIAVFTLASAVHRLSVSTATWVFVGYSILNGITLSGLLLMYTGASVFLAFFITSATFLVMTIYGYTTKADLTEMGKLMFMGLIGIIIASLANLFFRSPAIDWIVSYVGVAVFIGLTAYDTQKLKAMLADA